MTIAHALFMWPETVSGWAGLILALVLIIGGVGGIVVGLQRRNIKSEVYHVVHTEVPLMVESELRGVNVKLDGIRINQAELSAELSRVRVLEAKIDNGLTHKVNDIGEKVDRMKQRQIGLVGQVSEMHGWMQARREYDGTDRRAGD